MKINKTSILLVVILSFLIILPKIEAAFSPPPWDSDGDSDSAPGPSPEDFQNIMSGVLLYMFGEVKGEGDEGMIRFALFLLLMAVCFFLLSKIFIRDEWGESNRGKPVAVVVAIILAYIGARGAPQNSVKTLLYEVSAVTAVLFALMMPGIVFVTGYFIYKQMNNHTFLQRIILGFTLILGGALLITSTWGMFVWPS